MSNRAGEREGLDGPFYDSGTIIHWENSEVLHTDGGHRFKPQHRLLKGSPVKGDVKVLQGRYWGLPNWALLQAKLSQ